MKNTGTTSNGELLKDAISTSACAALITRILPLPVLFHPHAHRAPPPSMAPLDPTVVSTLDSHLSSHNADDIDEDVLLESLDNDPAFDNLREQRLQQLHAELTRAKHLQSQEYGHYTEIKDEKALMDITTSTKWCVVHFFKPDFGKCGVMDSMLEVGGVHIGLSRVGDQKAQG